ncbi:MAG: L,D-transpeptidase family protein [Pseudomonadota bacterium]
MRRTSIPHLGAVSAPSGDANGPRLPRFTVMAAALLASSALLGSAHVGQAQAAPVAFQQAPPGIVQAFEQDAIPAAVAALDLSKVPAHLDPAFGDFAEAASPIADLSAHLPEAPVPLVQWASHAKNDSDSTPGQETFNPVRHAVFKRLHHPNKSFSYLLKRDYAAAFEFYAARRFDPVWYTVDGPNEKALALSALFEDGLSHGFEPLEYPVPLRITARRTADGLGAAEVQVALSVLRYGRDAQSGRIKPDALGAGFDLDVALPDPIAILADVSSSADPAAHLEGYHPRHPQYAALRAALVREKSRTVAAPSVTIPKGGMLKQGSRGERVQLLRTRLDVSASETPETFDAALHEAVVNFQKASGLSADGIVGPATLRVLNGETDADRTAMLIANMERWRWMPRDLGEKHVFVNIPHYTVRVMEGDAPIYTGRVVVGKPRHMTVVFSDVMEHIVVNPYWNVPRSIARNEILPRLRSNPGYGYKYEVIHASGKRVDPASVDWSGVSSGNLPFRFRQPPGARNALGRVKYLFPNKHAIYLHDTPSRSLFSRYDRAFSHGCIRLHEPMAFGEALVRHEPKITGASLKRMLGSKERWVNMRHQVPVHLAYFTAWADEAGVVSYRRDVYGHDRRTAEALDRR